MIQLMSYSSLWRMNTTKLVFSMFKDNLLAYSQWLTFSSSTFKLVSIDVEC